MNIRDLQYLIAIADYKNFSAAAAASFVSQPALSMQIKKLENFLGVQLIERTTKSVLLTEAGRLITEHARDILCRIETIKEVAKQARDPMSGELHLGVIPTLSPYLLPHIIPHLSKKFPKLTIYLVEEQTATLMEKVKQGKLDGALLGPFFNEYDFVVTPIFEEEFMLAVPMSHAWLKRKSIKISDLENQTLLLLNDGHCMRGSALEICYKANASESKTFQATSLETLRYMVSSNAGMTLIPKLACRSNDGIHYLSFQSQKPSRTISMISRPSSAKKVLLQNVIEQIKKSVVKINKVKVIE